jgi:hypothetical protein
MRTPLIRILTLAMVSGFTFVVLLNRNGDGFTAHAGPPPQGSWISVPAGTRIRFCDMYVQPVDLGWHFGKRLDFNAGYSFFAPTGRYTAGATDHVGSG